MTKIEQPSSLLLQKPQIIDLKIIKKLIQELEIGTRSSHLIRNLIEKHHPKVKLDDSSCKNMNDDFYKSLDHHSRVVLDTFLNSISMLNTYDFDRVYVEKRLKHEHDDDDDSLVNHPCKSEVSANDQQHSPQMSFVNNGGRECYKKRNISEESSEKVVTHLKDDGFAWRKYGQKSIHNSDYPRHYYRCTHKNEKNCRATRQIQQVSQNPKKYRIKYNGIHTCNNNNIFNTSPYMIDSPEEQDPLSAFVLSFDGSNPVNPLLFPPSGASDSYSPLISNPVVEQSEETSIGLGEDYSPITPTSSNYLEEDYGFILADFSEPSPDFWTF